jgi:hypothetical protein
MTLVLPEPKLDTNRFRAGASERPLPDKCRATRRADLNFVGLYVRFVAVATPRLPVRKYKPAALMMKRPCTNRGRRDEAISKDIVLFKGVGWKTKFPIIFLEASGVS